ncbi:MAG TPA: radical SAM protein [bacterium]|nr:radical SAM protein [bacterium]
MNSDKNNRETHLERESPEYVKLSLAAAMQLGYSPARFHRAAQMTCINLLLTYSAGCAGNCSYCGLARERLSDGDPSFIRVPWPIVEFTNAVGRIAANRVVKRVCISMVTHARSVQDSITMARSLRGNTDKPVSALIAPTLVNEKDLAQLKDCGVDKIGIAFDLPTESLFETHRGSGVRGPHRWKKYWQLFESAVALFGEGNVGSHFIVGLGETEREMVEAFQRVRDLGGVNHLFSFYPEPGSTLTEKTPPAIQIYRRMQIACELIDADRSRANCFRFDDQDRVVDFGVSADELETLIQSGVPFRTRGCVGHDGAVACNRPYANSSPAEGIRNYPFQPNEEDLLLIRKELSGAA